MGREILPQRDRARRGEASSAEPVERLLRRVPFFRDLDRVDVARLAGALERVEFSAGSLIFAEGAPADALYVIEAGRVAVSIAGAASDQPLTELEGPAYIGELGLLLRRRTGSVRAQTDVQAWRLPRQQFDRLVQERPTIGLAMAGALAQLVDRRSRERAGAPLPTDGETPLLPPVPAVTPPRGWQIAAIAIALGIPLALWGLPPPQGLSPHGWHVGLIVLGAALAWLMEPLPDFVIALAMVTAWGLAGLVPFQQAFAGFTTPSYIVALGALGLAAAMARSGLLYRISLLLLKTFPATYAGQVLALLAGGLLVTPLMSLGIGRVAAITPLTHELAQGLGYPPRSRGSAGLAFAGILGYAGFSSIFFTGLAMNFYVYGLLPPSDRAHTGWLTWLVSAIPMGLVILAGLIVMLLLFFRPKETAKPTTDVLERQERLLGPLSRQETATIAGLSVLLLGLLFQPVLRIDSGWLALFALMVVIAGGALDRENFRTSIEWGFLVLFGILLGSAGVLQGAGIDQWVGDALVPLAHAVSSPSALIMLLGVFVVVCRLVLPWIPATLLLSLALVPAAPQLGLPPWIVGFVVLMTANTWLHPRQSDYCRIVRDATKGEMFAELHGLIVGCGLTFATLVGLALSLPYWRAIGLLGH